MKKILLLTTMYPNDLRPGTLVCHYFVKEWQKMGYDVLVIYYRSMFPPFYTWAAKMFPKLVERYVGNHVEMDRNHNVIEYTYDGVNAFSIPIFKYVPHGAYTKREINKQISTLQAILKSKNYIPDAIIGHFYNPQFPIVSRLKEIYPTAKTCVSLHEMYTEVYKKVFKSNFDTYLKNIDVIGFRSNPIKESFEKNYGSDHKSLLCYSGTSSSFLSVPKAKERVYREGRVNNFIYVGQFIDRKYPEVVAQALDDLYPEHNFHITYVGKKTYSYEKVAKVVNNLSLAESVTFTGQISRDEIIKLYDDADVFVMISKNEVFGLVYLEAMSRGCITIASKNEGMEGIIEDGVNGFMCKAGDKEELKSIITKISSLSAAEKKQISLNAMKTAAHFSDRNVALSYINNVLY